MIKVLVTGADGQLGSEIRSLASEYPVYDLKYTTRNELDLSSEQSIETFFENRTFDVIINCAAYTAVDKAESDETMADVINHQAVKHLAEIAKSKNIKLIHISTDYVFSGEAYRPYIEDNPVSPQGVYGKTKLMGENALIEQSPNNSLIIRTSWVYSSYGNNFVKTMLRLAQEKSELGVIFDQVGTPTYARDLGRAILDILPKISNDRVEIYHYSNEGVCSWYDFAKAIFEISGSDCRVNPIETEAYPTPAKRPHYSLLNKSKIKTTFDLQIPYWKDSLQVCLKRLKENNI